MEKLLSLRELESFTGRRIVTWRKDIREGRLPVVRLGRLIRVPESAVKDFILASTTPASRGPRAR